MCAFVVDGGGGLRIIPPISNGTFKVKRHRINKPKFFFSHKIPHENSTISWIRTFIDLQKGLKAFATQRNSQNFMWKSADFGLTVFFLPIFMW